MRRRTDRGRIDEPERIVGWARWTFAVKSRIVRAGGVLAGARSKTVIAVYAHRAAASRPVCWFDGRAGEMCVRLSGWPLHADRHYSRRQHERLERGAG